MPNLNNGFIDTPEPVPRAMLLFPNRVGAIIWHVPIVVPVFVGPVCRHEPNVKPIDVPMEPALAMPFLLTVGTTTA